MAVTVQFVDSIAASPTVRVDLNNRTTNGWGLAAQGIDFSPPPLRRAVVSSMLVDGDRIPASAYGNRTLTLPVEWVGAVTDTAALTAVSLLHRELNRPTNLLKVQFGALPAVFFRTFRAPDTTLAMLRLLPGARTTVTLTIPAEPFALGLEETALAGATPLTAVSVSWNPATGTYPARINITNVKGDVETPLLIQTDNLAVGVTATRSRGTPTNFVNYAKITTTSTDTSSTADATGTGGTRLTTTFATVAIAASRCSVEIPTASTTAANKAEWPGTYRVLARVGAPATFPITAGRVVIRWKTAGEYGPYTAVPAIGAGFWTVLDLGLIQLPFGSVATSRGYGAVWSVAKLSLILYASRSTGTDQLTWDYLRLVPADERLAVHGWDENAVAPFLMDGPNDATYTFTGTDATQTGRAQTVRSGGLPLAAVSPATTSLFLSSHTAQKLYGSSSEADVIANNWTTTVTYWPRYLTPPGA